MCLKTELPYSEEHWDRVGGTVPDTHCILLFKKDLIRGILSYMGNFKPLPFSNPFSKSIINKKVGTVPIKFNKYLCTTNYLPQIVSQLKIECFFIGVCEIKN